MHDVIIIGGSYAGIAAALQLARARRSVLVIDEGVRRNRFAHASYGFLGQDGADPAELASRARAQLLGYPTVRWIDGRAENSAGAKDVFTVEDWAGGAHQARRLIFATGVTDSLPSIDGVAARWGKSIFHCPYCHGFELDEGAIGVIATGPMSLHQALMLPDWGRVTLLTNDAIELDGAQREELAGRGVAIEEKRIARIAGHAEVQFESGDAASFAGLFLASRTLPAASLPERLGCTIEETPLGLQIRTDAAKETSVPGVFACGDVARAPHSVSLAVADGAWAGAQTHRSLLFG